MKIPAVFGTVAAITLATPAVAAVVINPGNGHAYEFISTPGTFEAALAGAASMTYAGSTGYLATVTSKAEQDFIFASVTTTTAFLSGTDAGVEGTWQWIAGPETGTVFWKDGATVTYSNWGGGEPNNCCGGENNLLINWSPGGEWNDIYPAFGNYGYIVEFGPAAGAVPEATTWAMMLAGFGIVGGAMRRRKQVRVTYA
jgi:hypothetical protein